MVSTPAPTRQPRTETRLPGLDEIEQRHEEHVSEEIPDKTPKGPTPEEALADAQRVIAQRDEELAAANRRIETAETEAQKNARLAADANRSRIDEQAIAIDGAVTTAESRRDAASAKFKQAKADGDADAEAAAIAELSAAGAALEQARSTKTRFEDWKKQQANKPAPRQTEQPRQDQGSDNLTAESRKWLGDHPRYFADQAYQADALAAHNRALSLNVPEGSKAYVDFIDGELEKLYGKDHGQIDRKGKTVTDDQQTRRPRQQPNRSSTAAPPSRGSDSYRGGDGFEYTDPDSGRTLRLITGVDEKTGKPFETVQGTIPASWREFAKINRMSDVAYAVEQLKIQQDMEPGGNLEGLTYHQNGVYKA